MTDPPQGRRTTRPIRADDPSCGFRCGKHPLDDYFARHALANDRAGIGRAYVLPASTEEAARGLPAVVGDVARAAFDEP
jgi:hypothetical protein